MSACSHQSDIILHAKPWLLNVNGVNVQAGAHGLGLFATKAISSGSIVVEERPVATLPEDLPELAPEAWKVCSLEQGIENSVWAAALHLLVPSSVNRPTSPASLEFMIDKLALFAPMESETGLRFKKVLLHAVGLHADDRSLDELLLALLLVHFTGLKFGGFFWILGVIGHANHACSPNCKLRISSDRTSAQLVTIADIADGAEISFSYYGPYFGLNVATEARRAALQAQFEFDCNCALCANGEILELTSYASQHASQECLGSERDPSVERRFHPLDFFMILQPWLVQKNSVELQCGSQGICLVATSPLRKGDVIVEERPVASLPYKPPEAAAESWKSLDMEPTISARVWSAALHLLHPSDTSRPTAAASLGFMVERLALYAPMDSGASKNFRKVLWTALSAETGSESLEAALQALMLVHFTAIRRPEAYWLLAIIGHANHSCFPNCRVNFPQGGTTAQLIAATDVSVGDELCISYYGALFGVKTSTLERRAKLHAQFEFDCSCELCAGGPNAPTANQVARRAILIGRPPGPPPPRRG